MSIKKMNIILQTLKIDTSSVTPQYLQLVNSILERIRSGEVKKNDRLPSINRLSYTMETSRRTIERAYDELKYMGILTSVAGKGFFIKDTHLNKTLKILLLFNTLDTNKQLIYDGLMLSLSGKAEVDFHSYNNDYTLFKKIIREKTGQYDKYLLIPHFEKQGLLAYDLIDQLPKKRVILIDQFAEGLKEHYSVVHLDYENEIFSVLAQLKAQLSKYNLIKLIFSKKRHFSANIIKGLQKFCSKYQYSYQTIYSDKLEKLETGCVYIDLTEEDLVLLAEKIIKSKLQLGKDIGLISYNETPIKKILLGGITTISTDFKQMAEQTAQLVLLNKTAKITVPFTIMLRNSL